MNSKLPKKFGTILKFSTVAAFAVYTSLTSKVEVVHSLTPELDANIIQNIVPYETYTETNPELPFMEQKVVQKGINGLTVLYNGVKIEVQKP